MAKRFTNSEIHFLYDCVDSTRAGFVISSQQFGLPEYLRKQFTEKAARCTNLLKKLQSIIDTFSKK